MILEIYIHVYLKFEVDNLDDLWNKEVKANKQHLFYENSKFKDNNSDNIGARVMNLATHDVGVDKKHIF
jgi:hypothetical protein